MTLLVTPSSVLRRPFARWATGHNVRTGSERAFIVPDHLFTEIPDELLVGATLNDQPYVPA